MIKKKLFKYGSVFMCAAMMACSLAACGTTTANVQEATKVSQAAGNDAETTLSNAISSQLGSSIATTSSSSTTNSKDETVYVFANANGKQDHVIVNEKLNNVTGQSSIKDLTNLDNIKNLSGDETSTSGSGKGLTWNANGNSITYQGTTTQEAPVSIKVTYYMDGKEISAKDLAGKSGKVTMRYDFKNYEKKTIMVNGEAKTAYVPFTMITGMMLPSDKFSNIEVTNGKLMEYNDGSVALGVTMPGLKDSLNLTLGDEDLDIDIPEYFEVTADVNDFELDMTMSVASNNLLSDVNLDNLSTDSLDDKMNTLTDAANQLQDGSATLSDGLGQLASNVPTLTDGVSQLDNAAGTLQGATAQLASGGSNLKAGVNAYTEGVSQAAGGSDLVTDGANQVNQGINAMSDEAKNVLVQGVAQLNSGIHKLANTLNASFAEIKQNADQYGKDYTAALTSAASMQQMCTTPIAAAGGVTVNDMLTGISGTYAGGVDMKLTTGDDLASQTLTKDAESLLTKYLTAYTAEVRIRTAAPTAFDSIDTIIKTASKGQVTTIEQAYQNQIGLLLKAVGNGGVSEALSQVYTKATTTKDPETGMNLSQSLNALCTGADQLQTGIGSFDNLTPERETICSALYKLQVGTNELSSGSKNLNTGLSTLKSKNNDLNSGVATLADATSLLADKSVTLKDATGTLNSASITLGDAINQLSEGSITLKDGMVEFNETGVKKLASLVQDDGSDCIDTLKAVVNLGSDYQSFGGKTDDLDGSVKFIYKLDEISK